MPIPQSGDSSQSREDINTKEVWQVILYLTPNKCQGDSKVVTVFPSPYSRFGRFGLFVSKEQLLSWGVRNSGIIKKHDFGRFNFIDDLEGTGLRVDSLKIFAPRPKDLQLRKDFLKTFITHQRIIIEIARQMISELVPEGLHLNFHGEVSVSESSSWPAPVAPPVAADVVTSAGAGAVGVSSSLLVKRGISQADDVSQPTAKRGPGQQ